MRLSLFALCSLFFACESHGPTVAHRPESPAPVVADPSAAPEWGGLVVHLRGDRRADRALVLLHGFGAPGDDMVSLGAAVAGDDILAVMPEAPLPWGGRGRMWWPLDEWRDRRARGENLESEIPDGLAEASARIDGVLLTLAERGISADRVVVAGFSQGAMLATDVGLRASPKVAGIAVLSGAFLARPRWEPHFRSAPPMLFTHGTGDPILAFARVERLVGVLREAGATVDLVPFEGDHTISRSAEAALRDHVVAWLAGPATPSAHSGGSAASGGTSPMSARP